VEPGAREPQSLGQPRAPWWCLPNWLGLDSPSVALAWTWAAGRAVGRELPLRIGLGFFLFVWSIYLADRLIDVARCPDWSEVPERLRFGRRHRLWFQGAFVFCLLATVSLTVGLPGEILSRVLLVAPGVLVYFGLFVAPVLIRRKLPGKEFAIGFFCTLPAWVAFGWDGRFGVMLPLYALLIALNCLVIASRERELDGRIDPGAATAWWGGLDRQLPGFAVGLAVVSLALALLSASLFLGAVGAGAMALLILHLKAPGTASERVRALADLCLFVPPLGAATWNG
jgi:hypothetical protein